MIGAVICFCIVTPSMFVKDIVTVPHMIVDHKHNAQLLAIIDGIPPDDSIITQNNIFSHVSSRENAYTVPSPMWSAVLNDGAKAMLNDIKCENIEWVLIDYNTNVYAVAGGDVINQSFVQRCNKNDIRFLITLTIDGIVLFHNNQYAMEQD